MTPAEKNRNTAPPHSLESEQACLGAVLIDPTYAFHEIAETLSPDAFYQSSHQAVFQAMLDLNQQNLPIDTLTVSEKLKEKNLLEASGGPSYLAHLATGVPTSANVKYYAKIVQDKHQLRRLMAVASKIHENALTAEGEVEQIVDEAEKEIFNIAENRAKGGNLVSIKSVLDHAISLIEQRTKNKGIYTGVASGFRQVDDMTYGFQNSDLIILAARPSMGKTALALSMVSNMALYSKKSVLFFSLEMSRDALVQRMISSIARIDSYNLRSGFLQKEDFTKLWNASGRLSSCKIWIEDTPGISYMDIRAISRRLKAKEGLDIIFIDYLQLITLPSGRREENRQNTVAEISRNLKMLARELSVPVIALAQVSRAVESRSDKQPMLSDLRESGAIEQDADLVAFIHRPGYYNREDESLKNIAELIIAKQRNGPTGVVKLVFIDKYTSFEDHISEEAARHS